MPAVGRGEKSLPQGRFTIDLDGKTVACPAEVTVPLRASGRDRHAEEARFGAACRTCR
jgi:hypothetical protein